ncbi:protein tyrosine phosphatase [Brucella sp. 191011898]|nr:protein tyrosine phosphatase [Brucella sp. 191011898]
MRSAYTGKSVQWTDSGPASMRRIMRENKEIERFLLKQEPLYYGGIGDFELVYRMVLAASTALADQFWPERAIKGQASSTI